MLLAKARKISHHIVGPLVLLWLLCQSMVLCAGLMGNDAGSNVVMKAHQDGAHHSMAMPQASAEQAHHHSSTNDMVADCCDDQESYLSNSFFSSIVFLVLLPLYWLMASLGQRLKHSIYNREPPPRYNYPRNHIVNCTFLN